MLRRCRKCECPIATVSSFDSPTDCDDLPKEAVNDPHEKPAMVFRGPVRSSCYRSNRSRTYCHSRARGPMVPIAMGRERSTWRSEPDDTCKSAGGQKPDHAGNSLFARPSLRTGNADVWNTPLQSANTAVIQDRRQQP